jgi:PPM family protein phosphatase
MTIAVTDRAGMTHTGHQRRSNEDAYLLREPLFMVADGVGGARAGEVAARMCAEAFAEVDLIRYAGEEALREAIARANRRIWERAHAEPALSGMGTTVTAALVQPGGEVAFANVGDSRAYLLREGGLQRLSEDHSFVGELVRSGRLSEAEAEHHPQRNVVTRALGSGETVEADTFTVAGQDGDIVLLCSDGLNTMVADARIAEALAAESPAEEIARDLVRLALEGGGEDNVTVVVFRLGDVLDEEEAAPGEETQLLPRGLDGAGDDDTRGLPVGRLVIGIVLALALAAAIAVGAVVGLSRSHFIGADTETGRVTVYQGFPVDLWAGIELYRPVYRSQVRYSSLQPAVRAELFDHTIRSRSDARKVVDELERSIP